MNDWKYCELIERIKGSAIRVIEHNSATGQYRGKVYNARGDLGKIDGEVYV